jgi:hypothetical protein
MSLMSKSSLGNIAMSFWARFISALSLRGPGAPMCRLRAFSWASKVNMLMPDCPQACSEERNLFQVSCDFHSLSLNPMSSFIVSLPSPIGQIL